MRAALNVLIWISIFFSLILFFSFKTEIKAYTYYYISRVLAVLVPNYTWNLNPGEMIIARNKDGHFYVNAIVVNGVKRVKLKFLIDTGASDVALTAKDALKLGYNVAQMQMSKIYNTANGKVRAAPIMVQEMKIGPHTAYNIRAHISSDAKQLDTSLLGMSALETLESFSIKGDLLFINTIVN